MFVSMGNSNLSKSVGVCEREKLLEMIKKLLRIKHACDAFGQINIVRDTWQAERREN